MEILSGKRVLFSCLFAFSLLCGCSSKQPAQAASIANPASEHCVKKGGRLEIRTEADGQRGYCHLPGGRVVEEWTLFRESNAAAAK